MSDKARDALLAELDAASAHAKELDRRRAVAVGAFVDRAQVVNTRCAMIAICAHPSGFVGSAPARISRRTAKGYNINVTEPAALKRSKGKRLEAVEQAVGRMRRQLASQLNERAAGQLRRQIAELRDPNWYRFEIVYFPVEIEKKLLYEGKSYPSRVRARALVWDYAKNGVGCTAQAEEVAVGKSKVYYRRAKGITEADMRYALEGGLLDNVFDKTLRELGAGSALSHRQ